MINFTQNWAKNSRILSFFLEKKKLTKTENDEFYSKLGEQFKNIFCFGFSDGEKRACKT